MRQKWSYFKLLSSSRRRVSAKLSGHRRFGIQLQCFAALAAPLGPGFRQDGR